MKKQIAISVGVLVLGAAGGYLVGNKLAQKKWQNIADEEINAVRQRYALLRKDGVTLATVDEDRAEKARIVGASLVKNTLNGVSGETYIALDEKPEVLSEEEAAAYNEYGADLAPGSYSLDDFKAMRDEPFSGVIHSSVFDADPGTDPEDAIMPDRDPLNPYVITVDEYMDDDDEKEYSKVTLAYWEGDDTLADEKDNMLPDAVAYVGQENLTKFGLGSKDKNIVYIRNEKIAVDYEIVRDSRSFEVVILKIRYEENVPKVLRMREDD